MVSLEKIASLAKRRGFIFPGSEVYGGINGFWDYGPLGVELRNSIKKFWWDSMVRDHENVVGLDAAIITHPKIWEASGHVEHFNDPMVDCVDCKKRYKQDALEDLTKCPECGGELTEPKQFNMMFKTTVGANDDNSSIAYLRPETAQAIYVNFKNCQTTSRRKLPFGIAQIGKAFRNEINPRNFTFRSREFEQMEMQFFVNPKEDEEWFEYWLKTRLKWYEELGFKKENITILNPDKLAHYAKAVHDIEYKFPFGVQEIEGIHNRTDYDLSKHTEFAGKDFSYSEPQGKEKYIPYIIETSAGLDRCLLAVLCEAYHEEKLDGDDERIVLKFNPKIAPIQIAVFPLAKKLKEESAKVEKMLRNLFRTEHDYTGSIGKKYRRYDEIGTPYCITFDFESLEDKMVTVRDRDTMKQERVAIADLQSYFLEKLF